MDPIAEIPMENVQITAPPHGYDNPVSIKIRARNQCGWGAYSAPSVVLYGTNCNRGYIMAISPNPASGGTTISIEPTSEAKTGAIEWDLEVYNHGQQLKTKKTRIKSKSHRMNTQGWQEGVYIVKAKMNDEILTGKLVVKK